MQVLVWARSSANYNGTNVQFLHCFPNSHKPANEDQEIIGIYVAQVVLINTCLGFIKRLLMLFSYCTINFLKFAIAECLPLWLSRSDH